jgi:hypothetical protein
MANTAGFRILFSSIITILFSSNTGASPNEHAAKYYSMFFFFEVDSKTPELSSKTFQNGDTSSSVAVYHAIILMI